MTKYCQYEDYDTEQIDTKKGEILKLACCDCGLVHFIGITIIAESLVELQFASDERATAQLRRHRYGYLQQDKVKNYVMRRNERL